MKNSIRLFLPFYDLLMLCLAFIFMLTFAIFLLSFKKMLASQFSCGTTKKGVKNFSWTCTHVYVRTSELSVLVSEGMLCLPDCGLMYTYGVSLT